MSDGTQPPDLQRKAKELRATLNKLDKVIAKSNAEWLAATHADIARFTGHSVQAVNNWARMGMPGTQGAYDLSEIIQWLRRDGPWKQHAKPEAEDDPLLSGAVTPGLERYRNAKADLAEMEVEAKRGSLLPRDKVRSGLNVVSTILRRCGERLGKRFGPEAPVIVNEHLEECKRALDYEFGDTKHPDSDGQGRVGAVPGNGDGPSPQAD